MTKYRGSIPLGNNPKPNMGKLNEFLPNGNKSKSQSQSMIQLFFKKKYAKMHIYIKYCKISRLILNMG